MAFKQFLQNLFERVGLAEAPLPTPESACVVLAEAERIRPTLQRLAAWGVKRVQFVAGDVSDVGILVQATQQAAEFGLEAGVRGRASDLAAGKPIFELAAAGLHDVELPLLSSVAEVHDAVAGMGDYRNVLRVMDALASLQTPPIIQLVLTPTSWKTIERTLEMLDDRDVRAVRPWAIACRDNEPVSWALSAKELPEAAAWIEARPPREMQFNWYPPLRFDPRQTLAQQVRRGPRAARDAVRVKADGSILSPVGPPTAGGNVSQNDWKLIARSEVFRAWKHRRDAASRCEQCPGRAACEGGCLRDEGNWEIG
jgi:radical SAM protein with 4Fe4S-binding SPASM domain